MGEMIEFPNNEERLFYLGKQSYEQGDYLKALQHFNASYVVSQSLEVNYFLVKTLMQVGQSEEAVEHIKEYEENYKTQIELQPFYFEVLLKEKLFLVIEKWLNQLDESHELTEDFKQTLNKTQYYWTEVDKTEYNQRLCNIESMAELSFVTQKKRLKEANYLTKEDFFKICSTTLLVNQNISPLIRAQIIDELVQLGFEDKVSILDVFGQLHHHTDLGHIDRLMKSVRNHPLYKELSIYLENNQPTQETLVLNIVQTHLGMMYPYIDDVVTDIAEWYKAYLTYFCFDVIDDQEVVKINQKIQLLDGIMMNTMTK